MATMTSLAALLLVALLAVLIQGSAAASRSLLQVPGTCTRSRPCAKSAHCCSEWGWCGVGNAYCGDGCVNGPCKSGTHQPPSPPISTPPKPKPPTQPNEPPSMVEIFTKDRFERWFKNHLNFYSYSAFTTAAKKWPAFGNKGQLDDRKREIAAFFANVRVETGGLTEVNEKNVNPKENFCSKEYDNDLTYPCAPGKRYFGRGPLQISWNYNYGKCSRALDLGEQLLTNPERVANDAVLGFMTALWFWMEPHWKLKRSCHDAVVQWPSGSGFSDTIKIINSNECGTYGRNSRVRAYEDFCRDLNVDRNPRSGSDNSDQLGC